MWQAGFAPVFLCRTHVIHNYIIKYLIFCMESVFCDKIYGTQFIEFSNSRYLDDWIEIFS
ncbi:hypothetical protein B1J93_14805 [Leptospira kirschneri serovar Pomona]|uniref:Uncharacterized protein n=1 Tax=Leptospira kirschneri serovar Pomona TaxID=561005 RepID=A0A1T1DJ95_9LEPT|nr:hypothetical protein B1J93_14805 [Leptospira kirschneri serovar Pomona]